MSSIRYDANGNLYAGTGGLAMTYDESNRLASARPGGGSNPVEYYGYAPDNKRVLRVKSNGTEEWTMYGARGEKLGVYTLSPLTAIYESHGYYVGQQAWFTAVSTNIWFDGRLVAEGVTAALPAGSPVYQDRLGTNRANGARFYPYGEEMGGPNATANDRVKFGTYTRDGFSGLDYADQRYYAAVDGRFNTADSSEANVDYLNPASLNRYAYVNGDAANRLDPTGTWACANDFSDDSCDPYGNPEAGGAYVIGLGVGGGGTGLNCGFPFDQFGSFGCGCASRKSYLSNASCLGVMSLMSAMAAGFVEEAATPQPTCTIQVQYRGLDVPFIGLLAGHSYLHFSSTTGLDVVVEGADFEVAREHFRHLHLRVVREPQNRCDESSERGHHV